MRTRHNRRGAAGLSLIELLVALGLVGVVLAAAGTMLFQAYASEAAYREQNSAQQNARTAADAISDDMRGAKKAMTSTTPPVPNLSETVVIGGSAGNNTATFTILDASDNTAKQIVYSLQNGNLMRQVGGAGAVAVARNITSLTLDKPYAGINNYNVVRIVVEATDDTSQLGTSLVRVRVDLTLRNNLIYGT